MKQDIKISVIIPCYNRAKTCLVKADEVNFDINTLNGYLCDDYEKRNNDISIQLFNQYYRSYYESAMNARPNGSGFYAKIKWLVKQVLYFNQNKTSNLLLLHNIRIDSHRFIVQRALSLISEKQK